jgi:hypothetical protein
MLLAALAYFILPFDFITDMLPVIRYADDAALLAATIALVSSHITPASIVPQQHAVSTKSYRSRRDGSALCHWPAARVRRTRRITRFIVSAMRCMRA